MKIDVAGKQYNWSPPKEAISKATVVHADGVPKATIIEMAKNMLTNGKIPTKAFVTCSPTGLKSFGFSVNGKYIGIDIVYEQPELKLE